MFLGSRDDFYPESYQPLNKRSCTDVICLLIFVIFIGCWAAIGGWGKLNRRKFIFSLLTYSNYSNQSWGP